MIFKVKQFEVYPLFGKTRKKLLQVGLVIKDTRVSQGSIAGGRIAGALSAGACGPCTVPALGEPGDSRALRKSELGPPLWMEPSRERAGRRGWGGLLLSLCLCDRTAAFLLHLEASLPGGSKGKGSRREFCALSHIRDKS